MSELINWTEITGEKQRIYTFPGGDAVAVDGVVRFEARASGKHRLETSDGRKFFIAANWLKLEIVADKFAA